MSILAGNVPVTETCISANPTPSEIPSSSSSSFVMALAVKFGPQVEDVLVDFQNVFTGDWQSFTVHVINGFKVFRAEAFGWTITLARVPASPPNAFVVPQTVPAVVPVTSDGSALASVTLPEAGGPAQYWVPVLEKFKTAVLQTPEWTVIFQKAPKPAPTV